MPRKARITGTGIVHHIMARGIDGRNIFDDNADRQKFTDFFVRELTRNGYRCYAWALVPNHYHFLIRTSEAPLAEFMRRLNSDYARYYNKKHSRRGYLFQDRFRSIATQDQNYIQEVVRYIHLNPVRSAVCRNLIQLEKYPWCGHAEILGTRKCVIVSADDVLQRFGNSKSIARKKYMQYLSEKTGDPDDIIANIRKSNADAQDIHHPECWVIGDHDFLLKAIAADTENRSRIRRYAKEGWTIEKLAGFVAEKMHVDINAIRKQSRASIRADARKVVGYIGRRILGMPTVDIARYLGITGPCVSVSLDAGEKIAQKCGLANHFLNLRP